MQSFFIGLGATLANVLPWALHHMGVIAESGNGVPLSVLLSFRIGALVFLLAVLWTVFRTPEEPPLDLEAFEQHRQETKGFAAAISEIAHAAIDMPVTMRQLFWVQFMTWFGLSCTWGLFTLAIAKTVFHTTSAAGPIFDRATEWSGVCMAIGSVVCFLVALFMPAVSVKIGRPKLHAISLALGGFGILSVVLIHDQNTLLAPMFCYGIAWAAIIALPYAILSIALPPKVIASKMVI